MPMKKTLSEIAAFLQATVVGDGAVEIRDIKGLDEAGEGDLTFLANPKYRKKIATTAASAILVSAPVEGTGKNFIVVKDPYAALARLLTLYYPEERDFQGVARRPSSTPKPLWRKGRPSTRGPSWAKAPGSAATPFCTPASTSAPAPLWARIPFCTQT